MDTDGTMRLLNYKNKSKSKLIRLNLKDRQPVELLSNFFESSMSYYEYKTVTPEPYKKEYISKQYNTYIYNDKAVCMTKNIYPYLLNDAKKQAAVKLLGYEPESKPLDDWTKEEFVSYFATVIEGDGWIKLRHNKKKPNTATISIKSSDAEYLSKLKYLLEKIFNLNTVLDEVEVYKTLKGIKSKYHLRINPQDSDIYSLLVAPNVMTMDRKKNKIMEVFN